MTTPKSDTKLKKAVRWTILFSILLVGFVSPFSPAGCHMGLSVGFPLPYHHFINFTEIPFVWPIPIWVTLAVDAIVIFFLSVAFWRLQLKLAGRTNLLSGLRLAIVYGILSSVYCFYFIYTHSKSENIISLVGLFLAYAFYLPVLYGMDQNFSAHEAIVYARVFLLPELVFFTLIFANLTAIVKKIITRIRHNKFSQNKIPPTKF